MPVEYIYIYYKSNVHCVLYRDIYVYSVCLTGCVCAASASAEVATEGATEGVPEGAATGAEGERQVSVKFHQRLLYQVVAYEIAHEGACVPVPPGYFEAAR